MVICTSALLGSPRRCVTPTAARVGVTRVSGPQVVSGDVVDKEQALALLEGSIREQIGALPPPPGTLCCANATLRHAALCCAVVCCRCAWPRISQRATCVQRSQAVLT
jgi:hypothetical protein